MNMPLNIDWQQILLHLLNFVILFAILYFFLYEPVRKFMNERSEHYQNLDDVANVKFEKSKRAELEYIQKLAAADAEISIRKEDARKKVEEISAAKLKEAEEEAAKIVADARQNNERERAKMLNEARNEIAEMVATATEKLAVESITSDTYDLFLNAAKGSDKDE